MPQLLYKANLFEVKVERVHLRVLRWLTVVWLLLLLLFLLLLRLRLLLLLLLARLPCGGAALKGCQLLQACVGGLQSGQSFELLPPPPLPGHPQQTFATKEIRHLQQLQLGPGDRHAPLAGVGRQE